MCPWITGSCTSPRARISATACRTSSPARNARCDGADFASRCDPRAMCVTGTSARIADRPPMPCRRRCDAPPCDRSGPLLSQCGQTLQAALHLFDAVALDRVARAHVLVALEGHAAFLAGQDLACVVLEALELRELAVVDDDVVADQPHVGAALDHAVGDAAARHLADLGHGEDLENERVAQ